MRKRRKYEGKGYVGRGLEGRWKALRKERVGPGRERQGKATAEKNMKRGNKRVMKGRCGIKQ